MLTGKECSNAGAWQAAALRHAHGLRPLETDKWAEVAWAGLSRQRTVRLALPRGWRAPPGRWEVHHQEAGKPQGKAPSLTPGQVCTFTGELAWVSPICCRKSPCSPCSQPLNPGILGSPTTRAGMGFYFVQSQYFYIL